MNNTIFFFFITIQNGILTVSVWGTRGGEQTVETVSSRTNVSYWLNEGGELANGLADFQIFFTGFRIQSEILPDFWILQLQRIADSSIIGARILDFACNYNIFARISDSGRNLTADLVTKS